MGYTHYMRRTKTLPRKKFEAAAADCKAVVESLGLKLAFEYDQSDLPPQFTDELIRFNGVGEEDGHETFFVERVHTGGDIGKEGNKYFSFCKTARKPYDAAVCACLVVLNRHFGDKFVVSSDGDDHDDGWERARAACQKVLGYGDEFTLLPRFKREGAKFTTGYGYPEDAYRRHFEDVGGYIDRSKGTRERPIALFGADPDGCFTQLDTCVTEAEAQWKAAIHCLAYEANQMGVDGWRPWIESLLHEDSRGDWGKAAIFCDAIDEQGLNGNRIRRLLPVGVVGAV